MVAKRVIAGVPALEMKKDVNSRHRDNERAKDKASSYIQKKQGS